MAASMSAREAYFASYMRTAWLRYGSTSVRLICRFLAEVSVMSGIVSRVLPTGIRRSPVDHEAARPHPRSRSGQWDFPFVRSTCTFCRMQTRRLPVEQAMYRMSDARHRLPRVFGTGQLVILGLGVMIGAGIFSLSGDQAAKNAGPAVIASFALAALVCFVAALSYAELSSTIPVAGSVYTFSYVAFGELWAWLVGWALILELLVAAALVSRAWSAYSLATLDGLGVELPATAVKYGAFDADVNLIAPGVLIVLTLLVVTGTKLSARVLTVAVLGKVAVIALVIVVGARYVDKANYTPFVPREQAADAATGGGT